MNTDSLTIGEIRIFAGTFVPRNTLSCNGAILNIMAYQAAYSIVGTYYGGDGRVTFGVPDLRGRFPIGSQYGEPGPGLPLYLLGQRAGWYSKTLGKAHLPSHNHLASFTGTGGSVDNVVTVSAHSGLGDADDADNNYWATGGTVSGLSVTANKKSYSTTTNTNMSPDAIKVVSTNLLADGLVTVEDTGSNAAFDIMNPFLGVNYIFAAEGIYPSRS